MKAVGLGSYSITIARDNTGQPAAYVNNSQEASASGEEAILASFLQDARDAGAEDALYAAIATSQAAAALGKLGGKAKSPAKAKSARENGRKGGRPPKEKLKPGHYWAAIDHHGKQVWGDTVRRNVERAAGGLPIIQRKKD